MLSFTELAVTAFDADAYIESRGLIGWPVASDAETQALRRGQDYIAREYNARWLDEWEDAPDVVQFAIFEAALREAIAPGVLAPVVTLGQAKVLTEVSGIKWTPLQERASVGDMKPTLTVVDGLLASVIRPYSLDLLRA
jgi:hypothetical protein